MMEWALPTRRAQRISAPARNLPAGPTCCGFCAADTGADFSPNTRNRIYCTRRCCESPRSFAASEAGGSGKRQRAAAAARQRTHLLRAQCNDAYWHGVFGGLYAPHLRTELWRELVRAEALPSVQHGAESRSRIERCDFDADGGEEIYMTSPHLAALREAFRRRHPRRPGFSADARHLINSMQRRVEAYHQAAATRRSSPTKSRRFTIRCSPKEAASKSVLRYDRWPRNAFRLLLFAPEKTFEDYGAAPRRKRRSRRRRLRDREAQAAARSALSLTRLCGRARPGPGELRSARQKILHLTHEDGFDVTCRLDLALAVRRSAIRRRLSRHRSGIEMVLNLLAPKSRTAISTSPAPASAALERRWIRWPARCVWWTNGRTSRRRSKRRRQPFWISPIETVSESEEGFERVYQGSQILIVWLWIWLTGTWRGEVMLRSRRRMHGQLQQGCY